MSSKNSLPFTLFTSLRRHVDNRDAISLVGNALEPGEKGLEAGGG